ncbi:MAG: hypothetical protein QM820_19520 [Minicystis sp.]
MNLACVLLTAACVLGAAAASGCTVSVEPGSTTDVLPPAAVPVGNGELRVRWLVDNTTDPAACDALGAADVEVVIFDNTGQPLVRETPPCDAFSITVPLQEGTYSAEVTLLSRGGRARSETKPLDAINVIAGTRLTITVGF